MSDTRTQPTETPRLNRHLPSLALLLLVSVLVSAGAGAQSPQTLPQLLERLGAEASRLAHTLPSFTCEEDVSSRELKKNKVVRNIAFTAMLRVRRGDDGKLEESFTPLTVGGVPFSGGFTMPTYVSGGFARSLGYFAPDHQACLTYTLGPHRIDFTTAPHLPPDADCRTEGLHGFALLDDDGNVTHVERTVESRFTRKYRLTPFAAIDFVPVVLNGTTYRLASHLLSQEEYGPVVKQFDATYIDCKLFSATVTLGPATEAPATPTATQPH